MADEPFALSTIPAALPDEADFDAIHLAVRTSVRGRWFLEEYAKRNRNADTGQLVSAIERIEAVIRGDIAQQAQQSMRIELLEMARAIAQTRAEVAETPPRQLHAEPGQDADVVTAAARLREIAAAMRGRGIEPSTSDKIEALASSILSAAPLHDPDNSRAQKLGEVLQYLEHRIDRLLDVADSATTDAQEAAQTEVPVAQPQEAAAAELDAPAPASEAFEPAAPEPAPEAFEAAALEIVALWTEPPPPAAVQEAASPPSPEMHAQAFDHSASEQVSAADDDRPERVELERVELDIEPLVVVPAATSDDTVDEQAEAQVTADPSLIWEVEPPQAPLPLPEPPPEPAAQHEEIELEPLTVLPLTVARTAETEQPAAAAEAATEAAATESAAAPQAVEAVVEPAAFVTPAEPEQESAPVPESAPPVAVETQVESDLETLGILTAEPPPAPPPPAPPIESDLLSNAWETAITAEPVETPPAEEQAASPEAAAAATAPSGPQMPSMWDQPPAAATKAAADEEAPADFLLEPLPDTDSAATQPEASPAHGQTIAAPEIEEELFEDEPEPITASVPPVLAAVSPAPAAVANVAASPAPASATASTPVVASAPVTAVRVAPKPMPRHAVGDPLAALKSMSDEERLALFT